MVQTLVNLMMLYRSDFCVSGDAGTRVLGCYFFRNDLFCQETFDHYRSRASCSDPRSFLPSSLQVRTEYAGEHVWADSSVQLDDGRIIVNIGASWIIKVEDVERLTSYARYSRYSLKWSCRHARLHEFLWTRARNWRSNTRSRKIGKSLDRRLLQSGQHLTDREASALRQRPK